MVAESELADEKNQVQYFLLPSRTILNRCANPSMRFQWTLNPYRGCEFGCKYCYARYTHEFMELHDALDFERKIYVKENAAAILRRELMSDRLAGTEIAVGTATDPYQPAERQFKVTRQILETMALKNGLNFFITTKSNLVLRDLDLLKAIAKNNVIRVNISITTTNEKLARLLEPRAPRPILRFRAVRALVDNGIPAGVFMMPLLPGITTRDENLEAVIRSAKEAGARYLYASVVFLMPSAQAHFFPFLAKHFPGLAKRYRRAFSQSAYLPNEYKNQIQNKVQRLKEKFGIPTGSELEPEEAHAHTAVARQLEFGFE